MRGTRFAVGGFTNLSQDHLDFHPTMEDYFQAKAKLFAGEQAAERAVLCIDDEWGERMRGVAKGAGHPVTTVATQGASATISARQTATEATGAQEVALNYDGADFTFRLPLPGEFNIANACLALGMAAAVGEDPAEFLAGVEKVAVPGRMERIDRGQDFVAVVDYAHKPAAIAAVLDTLRGQLEGTKGRVGIVVGAGGDRDSSKRPIMGAAAASRADLTVVTDDNPRSEDPATIRAAVMAGAREAAPQGDIREVGSRARAIDEVVDWAEPGDAVIVVGKGHEVGQLVDGTTLHFDDREEMARAIEEKLAGTPHRDTLGDAKE